MHGLQARRLGTQRLSSPLDSEVHLYGGIRVSGKLPLTIPFCHFVQYLQNVNHLSCGCSWIGHALQATGSPTSLTLKMRPPYMLLRPQIAMEHIPTALRTVGSTTRHRMERKPVNHRVWGPLSPAATFVALQTRPEIPCIQRRTHLATIPSSLYSSATRVRQG